MIGSIAQFISPIAGYLAYAVNRRKVMGVGTIMFALSYLTYVFAQDATALIIGTFIINLCFLQSPSMQSLIADSLSSEQMAVDYSLQMAIQRITPLVLTFFGGIFIERPGLIFGVRLSYTCCMLVGLIVAYI